MQIPKNYCTRRAKMILTFSTVLTNFVVQVRGSESKTRKVKMSYKKELFVDEGLNTVLLVAKAGQSKS